VNSNRKALGQYFTPPGVAALAAAACMTPEVLRVIDPMCGDGRLLLACANAFQPRSRDATRLVGFDVDERVLGDANRPFARSEAREGMLLSVHEAFSALATEAGQREAPLHSFDAVIGNPPYIRYQGLAALWPHVSEEIRNAFARRYPDLHAAQLMNKLMRASLVCEFAVGEPGEDRLLAGDALLASSARHSRPEVLAWMNQIKSLSGLADTSVWSWHLAWMLARPGGTIAFISSEAYKTRRYGSAMRRFFDLFVEPLWYIQPEDARWFDGALVRTALVVVRARSWDEVSRVVESSVTSGSVGTVVTIERPIDVASEAGLLRLVGDVCQDMRVPPPSTLPHAAKALFRFMKSDATASLGQHGVHVRPMPGAETPEVMSSRWPSSSTVFNALIADYGKANLVLLRDLGLEIHQGLRTGCNEFFYVVSVEEPGDQCELKVRLSHLFDSREVSIPKRYLRPVTRYQSELNGWAITDPPRFFALAVGGGARRSDLIDKGRRAGAEGLEIPNPGGVAGLTVLPPAVSDYIDTAEKMTVSRNGRSTLIPELSAVRTNSLGNREGHRASRWWYTLSIKDRHQARMLIPRVIHRDARAVLNAADDGLPRLIDANFSTIESRLLPIHAVLALMNSTWMQFSMEATGTVLGGGALKVEAAHLRRLPVPRLNEAQWASLEECGVRLAEDQEAAFLERADDVVFGCLNLPAQKRLALRRELNVLRDRRMR